MKNLLLVLFLNLIASSVAFSQGVEFATKKQNRAFVYPETKYNDFHDTNFNSLWGKKAHTIIQQVLATSTFKKVKAEESETEYCVVFKNTKVHQTIIQFYFTATEGLNKITITRSYSELANRNVLLPLLPGMLPDSEGIYRYKEKNVTAWRMQSDEDKCFVEYYIPYTTLSFK